VARRRHQDIIPIDKPTSHSATCEEAQRAADVHLRDGYPNSETIDNGFSWLPDLDYHDQPERHYLELGPKQLELLHRLVPTATVLRSSSTQPIPMPRPFRQTRDRITVMSASLIGRSGSSARLMRSGRQIAPAATCLTSF
jgi:hypothetical protein